jgi:hypothetical protein
LVHYDVGGEIGVEWLFSAFRAQACPLEYFDGLLSRELTDLRHLDVGAMARP